MGEYAKLLKKKAKEWACPDMMNTVANVGRKKIPFSSPQLNYVTYGGVPRGALSEFYGNEGGGKSTVAIDLCKNARKLFHAEYDAKVAELEEQVAKGKKDAKPLLQDLKDQGPKNILYVDLEHTYDTKWAANLGVAEGDIDVMQPDVVSAESILQALYEAICTGELGLIILDSIPSLVSEGELKKKIGEASVAPIAKLATDFCRKITQVLMRYDCTVIFINQLRDNISNPFAEKTVGGRALKYYYSLRLTFSLGKPLDFLGNELPLKTDNPAGYKIVIRVTKQKSASFDRKLAETYLMAKSGLRVDYEFVHLAIDSYGIIIKNKGWYYLCDPVTHEYLEKDGESVKINGLVKVFEYMQLDTEYYDRMCQAITDDINQNGLEVETSDVSE